MEPRAVERVVYDPTEGIVHILLRVAGLDDPQQQIDILVESGFREITRNASAG